MRPFVLLLGLVVFCTTSVCGQVPRPAEIRLDRKQTRAYVQDGQWIVELSKRDLSRFKAQSWVRYSDLGAKGDGKTDDMGALVATHEVANRFGLRVKADAGYTYYIGGKAHTAHIKTSTDFGTASFIIDDRQVESRDASVFWVGSSKQSFPLQGIKALKKGQRALGRTLPEPCLVSVTDSTVRRYIRFGLNPTNGAPQTDVILVDAAGNIDPNAPLVWDFDQISAMTALPIDTDTLRITGGRFTTLANQAESKYTYYSRNIAIRRSHVLVSGLEHRVEGEGEHGAPYGGFLTIADCAFVTVENTLLTGHKTYVTIGRADKPVSMGSYDISVNRALNVTFRNCTQTNDINDRTYWGIMGSNYSKNLSYDRCILSRFDAHMGVANATIRNSTLGHMGINAIGTGTLLIENSTIRGNSLVNFRPDYGSTWQGDLVIRNCTFVPSNGRPVVGSLISGFYSGQHNFGYTCYMPERIRIENVHIDDSGAPEGYGGAAIFANFNPEMKDENYRETYPYIRTKEVLLQNVTTSSGKRLRLSDNPFFFKGVAAREN